MTENNQKPDLLGELSRSWHLRLKEIRLAVSGEQKDSKKASPAQEVVYTPNDSDLFVSSNYPSFKPEQVFANDNSAINLNSLEPPKNAVTPQTSPAPTPYTPSAPAQHRKLRLSNLSSGYKWFSPVQLLLFAGVLLIGGLLVYELIYPISFEFKKIENKISTVHQPTPEVKQQQFLQPVTQEIQEQPQSEQPETKPQLAQEKPAQSFSLKTAQDCFSKEQYSQALDIYTQLYENLSQSQKEDLMKDYLQLQIALCTERLGQLNQAAAEFIKLVNTNSPAIRVVASYHSGLLEMQRNQYLPARTKAYQAIALIDAVDFDSDWAQLVKRNCYFLAAQALTREILTLCDVDKDQPAELWPSYSGCDEIFANLDEEQIHKLINAGTEPMTQAVLGPQIQLFDKQQGIDIYNIVCNGASIEELIGKFSTSAKLESRWKFDSNDSGLRHQLIYMYLLSAQPRQFASISAGAAGLLAQFDDKGIVDIYNPSSYSLLSDHLAVLSEQAISLWREFTFRFPDDNRLPTVHFALGLLYTPRELYSESISEYKLVANRFARSPLAPIALYNLGKIKNKLQDYRGAYDYLRQLMEQFPDSQTASDAALYYADTAGKANLLDESARLYRKVYNLALTTDSQFAAAYGAGKSAYLIQDYETAEKWLQKYITLASKTPSKDLYMSYLYLTKTYLAINKPDLACTSFDYAMAGVPLYLPKDEYITVLPTIVDSYVKQGSFVQALNLLGTVDPTTLSPDESVQVLLMKSKILRSMGLYDKAISVFGDRVEYTYDQQLKAQIYYELSLSYIEKEDLNSAGRLLSDIIVLAKPGQLMYDSSLKLADVCLKLNRGSQSVTVCRQLLNLQPPDDVKQKALQLLASAYKQDQNYDSAALALLGKWN